MFFGKKITIQDKVEAAGSFESRQFEGRDANGLMNEYLRCIDTTSEKWELAFVMNLSPEQFELLKKSSVNSAINVYTSYKSVEFNNCLIPVFFVRLNGNEGLSFAGLLRLELFREKDHPLNGLNMVKILNEQQKISITPVVNGKKMPGMYVTNQMKGYLSKDVAVIEGTRFDEQTCAKYSSARMGIKTMAMRDAISTGTNTGLGLIFWNRLMK